MSWSFQTHFGSAVFCPICQNLMGLPDSDLIMNCSGCKFETKFDAGAGSSVVSWSKKYTHVTQQLMQELELHGTQKSKRATVKEICPKCNHPELSFYTMQMRSVDEGQTVFYECPKCSHTYSTNT